MADKYNKVEPQISMGIIVSIVAILAVVLTLVFIAIPSNSEKIYAAYKNTADTEYFTEDHPFYEINANKVDRLVNNNETFLLLISSSDCQSCQQHIGTFQRYYEYTGADLLFDQINYLSPLDDPSGYARLVEDYEDIQDATPQLFLFVNGEIVLSFDASLSTTDQARNTNVRTFFEDAINLVEENE